MTVTSHPSAPPNHLAPDELRVRPAADGVSLAIDPARAGWRYLSFRALALGAGERLDLGEPGLETAVVILAGGGLSVMGDGGAELELARRAALADRADRFTRVVSALAEARRRNPTDWFHCRNQASAERVWAAADPAGRAAHLAAADDFYRQATSLAPASARLWAEWGNVVAERGALHDAFGKLEHAASLGDVAGATSVADAIFRATDINVNDPDGRARAVAQLRREGCPTLAHLYATQSDVR